jgi:Carbohydrate-binding module 64
MKYRNLSRLLIVFVLLTGLMFAVINNGGTNYTEQLMPVSGTGIVTLNYVVIGTGLTTTAGSNRDITTYTINGTDYKNSSNTAVTTSADDRYYIRYVGKKSAGSFSISGTNDWTTQTYTSQSAPFSQTGSGSYFYSTTDPIDSVITSNLDFFLINNVSYANSTITSFPSKINGTYYFYYGTTNASGSLDVSLYTPKLNLTVFIEGGL